MEQIELQSQVSLPQSMSKIDRIRRKLEQNKRKSILQEVTINPHLSHPSFATTNQQALPTTFSLFPLIAKEPSRNASTNHSERSLTTDPSQSDPFATGRKTHGHIFMERSRLRSNWQRQGQRQGHNVDQLAARTLNPSARINWACQKDSLTTPIKNATSCVINSQTPSAVVILIDPRTPSGTHKRALFRRSAPKRPSIMLRKPSTPPEKAESPTRKFSISAWDTYDQQ